MKFYVNLLFKQKFTEMADDSSDECEADDDMSDSGSNMMITKNFDNEGRLQCCI